MPYNFPLTLLINEKHTQANKRCFNQVWSKFIVAINVIQVKDICAPEIYSRI
jgi:hypothetical protein